MSGTEKHQTRVLFMAEAVTLAHVARPHVLACGLDPQRYQVRFACDGRYDALFPNPPFQRCPLETVSSQDFLASLEKGSPLYDLPTLCGYVEADLEAIDAFRPDVIVGDFRLSLAVSARLRQIPYATITNAYWSPHADLATIVPELPLTRLFGYRLGGLMFRCGRPLGFALHAQAHRQLRRRYGLPPGKRDMRFAYTDADQVFCADLEGLVPLRRKPDNYQFLGPVQWSPNLAPPEWWDSVKTSPRRRIYVTLGSSGDTTVLSQIVTGLSHLKMDILVATAGRCKLEGLAPNVHVADYLSGEQAAAMADLVVCNGGSPTTYQALAAGKPVLGIPSNLDQCLNMAAILSAGAGGILRVGDVSEASVPRAATVVLESLDHGPLQRISAKLAAGQSTEVFRKVLDRMALNKRTENPPE